MRRFVKLKAILLILLMGVATLSILPSFAQIAKFELPGWITNTFTRQFELGLDLQGGLHLEYSVAVDEALVEPRVGPRGEDHREEVERVVLLAADLRAAEGEAEPAHLVVGLQLEADLVRRVGHDAVGRQIRHPAAAGKPEDPRPGLEGVDGDHAVAGQPDALPVLTRNRCRPEDAPSDGRVIAAHGSRDPAAAPDGRRAVTARTQLGSP